MRHPPWLTREEIACRRAYPTILASYGDGIEIGEVNEIRSYVMQRITHRLAVASWDTIGQVIAVLEGESPAAECPPPKQASRQGRLAEIARVGFHRGRAGLAAIGVTARSVLSRRMRARIVHAWLFARLAFLVGLAWATKQTLRLILSARAAIRRWWRLRGGPRRLGFWLSSPRAGVGIIRAPGGRVPASAGGVTLAPPARQPAEGEKFLRV